MALIIVVGGSGQHASVVYEAAVLSGMAVAGLAAMDAAAVAPAFDCPWLGSLGAIADGGIARGDRFIAACGSNALRREISETLLAWGAELASVVHPAAIVSPSACIGAGTAVLAGAIIGPRAVLGCGVIVNHAASVDHDGAVGDYGNLCPGARLAGGVRMAPGGFVGINAAVLPGLYLAENAVVGAGAVVTRDVAADDTVVGIPAVSVRRGRP
ncbi:acetyltransferase [Novosphingobium clariflavum]|uniref:Acetyltransferase n=1 Tax=Novosphingobium clariflavum TaxID=2029884 RepID=A0ABV6SC46_9SPHN|nr:acetyltransferase [Novosphingobium clariflavum]